MNIKQLKSYFTTKITNNVHLKISQLLYLPYFLGYIEFE